MTRLPISLQSLVVQCIALLLAALLNRLLQTPFSYQPALWQLALAQGAIAVGLSLLWRQPAWWPPLHFGFLPAILLARQASVPAWTYLAAFLLLVLFYWSTFRTRVPLYLSDHKAWQAVAPLLPATQAFRFIDLGSGLGGVPFYLEPRFPQGRFYGTEIAPAPWLISRLRAWLKRSRVRFMRRDYATLNLADFDVVFAFLSPAAMPGLWQQAQAQMRSGSLFISLSFAVNTRQPDHVVTLAEGARHTLYAWRM
ncbi:MAG: class I SAM-dependent methyltransferase [Thiobacillus sp.]|nr:class I SAM-dependent methyltransferase [Thiobacillus sp.]MDP2058069.1 class I SAM-dependent methyltransferase [Thiobacillus sp.]